MKGLYSSDRANQDVTSNAIFPLIFQNMRNQKNCSKLFLLEMKVNRSGMRDEELDAMVTDLNTVINNVSRCSFDLEFKLHEFKENQQYVHADLK